MHRRGSGTFDDATGARASQRDITRDAYRARGLSARLGRDRVCSLCLEWLTHCQRFFGPLTVGLQMCRVLQFTPYWVPWVF
jgi:hypothetical protein